MSTTARGRASAPSLPYANRIRIVGVDQPYVWLRAGWRDFRAAATPSLAYGLIFVILGFALTFGLWRIARLDLLLPLASGFMLLIPLLSLGLQEISREIDRPGRPSFLRENAGSIMNAALAFMFVFLIWIRFAEIAFALAVPPTTTMDATGLLKAAFLTPGGLEFLALFLGFGGCLAGLTFMGGAFALPMLIDRDVSMGEAIATSFTACRMNPWTMTVWAVLVVGLVAIGMAFAYVGLAVTLPVVGHANWHAYRAVIAR
jgi:uncharacterized membrane protein